MSTKRHLFKAAKKSFNRLLRQYLTAFKKFIIWLLRSIFPTRRRRGSVNAGFVLPTVAMVALVVVLLTTAILFRSFDRAKNASNVRVNEAVLNAATPAIDRARAKLNKLFQDKTLPRATPTDDALYTALTATDTTTGLDKIKDYTFGDETPLKLLSGTDELRTAWRFPVDTDNNGKFDSYILYGIYFQTPPVASGSTNQYSRARTPLEARTPPMAEVNLNENCGAGTSALLVGNTGWVKQNNKLKKAFFVYTATVPITSTPTDTTNYERYQGNLGFSAIEYQQDRVQLPPNNNAVVYEDDLAVSVGSTVLNLNGRIFTNSNFIASALNTDGQVRFYQVSSPASCFYEADNSKIIVGGNTALGILGKDDEGSAKVDLFIKRPSKGETWAVSKYVSTEKDLVKSVKATTTELSYNNLAYEKRINKLVTAQITNDSTGDKDPSEVKEGIASYKKKLNLSSYTTEEDAKIRRKQLEIYFRKRTRRVPFKEVAFGDEQTNVDAVTTPLQDKDTENLRPTDPWIYPINPTTNASNTGFELNTTSSSLAPTATEPKTVKDNNGKEDLLGDRVLVGNNLPQLWWEKTEKRFFGPNPDETQDVKAKDGTVIKWDAPSATTITRTRRTLVETLADVGSTDRDGDWELAAAQKPVDSTEPVGGLRVITGAGIYLRKNDIATTDLTSADTTIWPDTKPVPQAGLPSTLPKDASNNVVKTIKPYWMYDYVATNGYKFSDITYTWPGLDDTNTTTPYLKMRATAVYHYNSDKYDQTAPKPIACVSSFYVPTNSTTAKNQPTYNSNTLPWNTGTGGLSNNGIVYGTATKTETDYKTLLTYQSKLKYPNGRLIDDGLLARALSKTKDRTLSEQSAIDSQLCALQILFDSTFKPLTTTQANALIPHGAIKETAFLDGRQVKQNSKTALDTTYNLPLEDRQPLEIRATVLDIDLLRKTSITGSSPADYLLPNSGIIYATRDDALPDMSADLAASKTQPTEAGKLESPVDYKLDHTRRPNAIMLINGAEIWREENYRDEEKGLILATNLPAYIKGDFNKHTQEEFTDISIAENWDKFYDRQTLNANFACRPNDPRLKATCTTGDKWRPATVLSDAVSLISANFKEGYRDEGDYDWNDSYTAPATVPTGFSKFNSFVPLAQWADSNGIPNYFSSYLNNFVTPIALRTIPGSYLTEACVVPTGQNEATYCNNQNNWRIQVGNSCNDVGNKTTSSYLHENIIGDNANITPVVSNRIKTGFVFQSFDDVKKNDNGNGNCFAGSNVIRRLALVRDLNGKVLDPLQVLAVDKNDKVARFKLGDKKSVDNVDLQPPPGNNYSMPWLKPTISSGQITGLELVLQIKQPLAVNPLSPDNTNDINPKPRPGQHNNWLQIAQDTTFNFIAATGDTPARNTEDNGGLGNFVRFMENWNPTDGPTAAIKARINGAFMQVKKSAYATAPYATSLDSSLLYKIALNSGRSSGYLPPTRQWGYDVGLLSQSPDLFAQKLVLTPPDLPNEYFREVGRDDKWVKTLLCAKTTETGTPYAIEDAKQRSSDCKS
ncbi:hypothetical protein NIES2100_71990 [Calothrix sp. NIES-2100]|uniref:hormogonium polysaccharide biosynthesis protein HpsA n=1 Tax=Calothrix sp. NIES-2100 TaxID=1954172 RepID=UPI000B5F35BA|nr:hypothetical protein NIES2100_71990 [Calothrix sp. NIES-2100]